MGQRKGSKAVHSVIYSSLLKWPCRTEKILEEVKKLMDFPFFGSGMGVGLYRAKVMVSHVCSMKWIEWLNIKTEGEKKLSTQLDKNKA